MKLPFDAEPVGPEHTARLRRAFAAADKRCWCYYAPFLCCFSLPPGREVFVAEQDGALWLPVRRSGRWGARLDLLVPPIPFSDGALLEVMAEFRVANRGKPPRVLWVDGADAEQLPADRFSVRPKDAEYLYEPARVAAASGRPYRDLRKRLNRFRREARAEFREMRPEDVPACEALLRHWRGRQGRRRPFLLDWWYTRAALERYGAWPEEDLQGWCVTVEGRVAAFAMAGRMQAGLANFFIAKADPDVRGLSDYLRWAVCGTLSDYALINDAGDLGLPGLRQHKQKFRPVAKLPVYSAEARGEERS